MIFAPRTLLVLALLGGSAIVSPIAVAAPTATAGNTAKFTLDHVIFTGNVLVDTATLSAAANLQPGQKIDRDGIVTAFDAVQKVYGDKGMGVSIQPEISPPKHDHIDVTFVISGEQQPTHTTVAPVLDHETIAGNVKVRTEQLLPALTLKPGDAVSTDKIVVDRDAILAIYKKAGVGVEIDVATSIPASGHVDVAFNINENPKPKKQ